MPPQLTKDNSLVGEPIREDWQRWCVSSSNTSAALEGSANVYYEVWNEPDLFGKCFMVGKKLFDVGMRRPRASSGRQQSHFLQDWWTSHHRPYKTGSVARQLYSRNNIRLDFISWHHAAEI
jgi:hypothetical protein